NRPGTIHDNQIARFGFDGLQVDEAHRAVVLGFEARLLGDSRCRAADVEGTHSELRSRFADRLCRDHAYSFAQLDQTAGGEVASVAHDADAALRFAGEHGANLYAFNARCLNRAGKLFGDLAVYVHDHVAFVVLDLLQRNAAYDAVAHRLDDLARFHNGTDVDAVERSAILLGDDHVLRHVNQSASEVAGIRRFESGVGQSLTRAVRGDEVLQDVETFAEVRRDRRLDDFARRLGHQSAHSRKLADLLFRTASAGVGHDVDRIDRAGLVLLLEYVEHLVGYFFRNGRPDFDDLVVTLAVSNSAVEVLLLNVDHLLLGVFHQRVLVLGDDHVVNADRQSRTRGVVEAERLDAVEHLHRGLETKAQIGIVHELADSLLLEQAIDVRHAFGKSIVEDHAANGRVHILAIVVGRLGVEQILVVVRRSEIEDLAGVAQTNRTERLHFSCFEREQNIINRGE